MLGLLKPEQWRRKKRCLRKSLFSNTANIPVADIERRFARSLANLLTTFSPVVDACRCFMNGGASPELVFEQHGEQRTISNSSHYQHLLKESES